MVSQHFGDINLWLELIVFPFICFDTEDNSPELTARRDAGENVSLFDKVCTQIAAIAADGRHYYNKGDVPGFKKWLLRQPEKFIYALNVGYDLGNLFADVLDELDCTLVGGRIIKAVWGDKIFLDVYNIWFQSVKDLGKVFGLHKLETESMSSDKAYVFRDVEIIREAMLFVWNFAAELGCESVPATLGGLGVKLWKEWGGESVHDSFTISRDARFGGRVELFKCHNETPHVRYTDINSLYPSVMVNEFPCAMEPCGTELMRFGIARVKIKIPECEISPLPYRTDEGKIYYAYGEMTGTWTVAEIRNAERFGAKIQTVHEAIGTNEGFYPYKTYMERIYEIRLKSQNAAEKELYKRLMNCLYGRTGLSGLVSRTVIYGDKVKHRGGVRYGTRLLTEYKMPLSDEVNWAHCSHVTSYGRMKLLEHLHLVGAENLIYCDTDSCIFDCPGEIPFETGKKLGIMKIERQCSGCGEIFGHDKPCLGATAHDEWPDVEVWAPKMYRLANIHKAKGVPKKLQKTFIETGRAEYDLPFKFREAVRWYDRGNVKKLSVWRRIIKEKMGFYDKKELRGNRFFPLQISENSA